MRALLIVSLISLVVAVGAICRANEKVEFVNPTQEPLFVQINEREPFEVPPGGKVFAALPALGRLTPITITARDRRGVTVFHRATSIIRIQTTGNQVQLTPGASAADPFGAPPAY